MNGYPFDAVNVYPFVAGNTVFFTVTVPAGTPGTAGTLCHSWFPERPLVPNYKSELNPLNAPFEQDELESQFCTCGEALGTGCPLVVITSKSNTDSDGNMIMLTIYVGFWFKTDNVEMGWLCYQNRWAGVLRGQTDLNFDFDLI